MAQHFLLSAQARTLSLKEIYQAGEDAAYATFRKLRWPETGGSPLCPRCSCTKAYELATRRKFKCAACHHQFSVTSGTIFACRKLAFVDLLAAICLFVNAAKGASALAALPRPRRAVQDGFRAGPQAAGGTGSGDRDAEAQQVRSRWMAPTSVAMSAKPT